MTNENEVKVDTTSQAQVSNEVQVELIAKNAERPTSFITGKGHMVGLRPTKVLLEGEHIHIVHLIVFFGLLFVLFVSMWKDGKKTKF